MNTKDQIKKLGISGSLVIFVGAGILMHLQTKFVIPWLSRVTGMEIIIFWFVIGGLGIFLPLILLGMFLLKREGVWGEPGLWRERLRFRRMGRDEWVWSVVGVVAVSLLSGLILKGMVLLVGQFDHSPPFMAFEPLEKGRYWLLLVWLPYWILNIFGEEFLWRGVMLPRQEAALGKYAWLFHGSGWGAFLTAAIMAFACSRHARKAAFLAVVIVLGWLAVQLSIIGYVSWMQPVTAAVALLILLLALKLPRTA